MCTLTGYDVELNQKINCNAKTAYYHYRKMLSPGNLSEKFVDLTKCDSSLTNDTHTSIWVEGLSMNEKDIILSEKWLNDHVINSAQRLLRRQFSSLSGLQDVSLGTTLSFVIEYGMFVQILHIGGNHWVAVSGSTTSHRNVVMVYDSLPPAVCCSLKMQVASLLCTQSSTITLQYSDVSMQSGLNDCGLYAIGYLVALANELDPSSLCFDQKLMRHHLLHCFEKGTITPFPVRMTRRAHKVKKTVSFGVYCKCRLPEMPGCNMIQCSQCLEWLHIDVCVNVPSVALERERKWICPLCC